MALRAVFCQQNVPENAEPVREALSSLVPNTGGVVEGGDFTVAQTTTPSLAVTVSTGRIWVPGTNVADIPGTSWSTQGQYFVINDALVTLTVPTPDATNPRIDLVCVTIPDSSYSGSSDTAVIQIVEGNPTPGATYPTNAPAVPNNSLALGYYTCPANATSITTSEIVQLAQTQGTLDWAPQYNVGNLNPGSTPGAQGLMAGVAKPAGARWKLFEGFINTTTGAGGDTQTNTPATDSNGYGGFWFGALGLPTFNGIYYVDLVPYHTTDSYLYTVAINAISTTRIKWKARRLDDSNWANGYGGITMGVHVLGW